MSIYYHTYIHIDARKRIKKLSQEFVIPEFLPNFASPNRPRKDAGAVERDGLENRCALSGTQGSNPCLSARIAPN